MKTYFSNLIICNLCTDGGLEAEGSGSDRPRCRKLSKQLISRGCGGKLHQPCEERHKSNLYDHKYVDVSKDANGELQCQTRELTHRLCSWCIVLVFSLNQNVTVKHSGSYPGLTFCQKWMLLPCRFGLSMQSDIHLAMQRKQKQHWHSGSKTSVLQSKGQQLLQEPHT